MKSKILSALSVFGQTALIVIITVISVLPISCKVSTEGIEISSGDYDSPMLENVTVIDERRIELKFSEWVRIRTAVVSPYNPSVISENDDYDSQKSLSESLAAASENKNAVRCAIDSSDDGKIVTFTMEESTKVGRAYEIFGIVEDFSGNSLTFCIPFVGYNPNIPKVLITEIQPKYKGTLNKNPVYRSEYAELLVLEDGNLCGMELFFASYQGKIRYELPAVDVKKGEVLLVHFREAGDGCICELGDNLALATRVYSNDKVRDLWSENKSKSCDYDNDILIVRNTVSDEIIDGVMFSKGNLEEWEGDSLVFAEALVEKGFYDSVDIDNSASSKNLKSDASTSMYRTDAKDIRSKIISDENLPFPIKQEKSLWQTGETSPGEL